jgi:hypothetical protein
MRPSWPVIVLAAALVAHPGLYQFDKDYSK